MTTEQYSIGYDEGYQAGWNAAMDAKPAQQEPVAWKNAALRVGEDLCSVGPFGYYDMTAEQWLDWALSVVTVHAPPPQLNDKLEAMAIECERMPFGDTGASFAAWIRGHKL